MLSGLEHIVRENEPLGPKTSLKMGGPARWFAEPTSLDELKELLNRANDSGQPVRFLGNGSNILVADDGVDGLVISLFAPAFGQIEIDDNRITSGSGVKMAHLIATSVREGLAGLHNLVGIPGTVGGAVHQNIGTQGFTIGSFVDQVKVMNRAGEVRELTRDSLSFSHRESSLNELLILDATFELEKRDAADLTRSMQQSWIMMRAAQPVADENSIYAFRDHLGESAADIIERTGLKGTSLGPVRISERNPNCLIAEPGATADDVRNLVRHIQEEVESRLEIELESAIETW